MSYPTKFILNMSKSMLSTWDDIKQLGTLLTKFRVAVNQRLKNTELVGYGILAIQNKGGTEIRKYSLKILQAQIFTI